MGATMDHSIILQWLAFVFLVWNLQYALFCIHSVTADSGDGNENQCSATNDAGRSSADPSLHNEDDPFVCGLYLAKSTIPNSGIGLFSGVDHNVGDVVAPPEIVHQILLNFDGHSKNLHPHPGFGTSLAHSYTWASSVSGGGFEASNVETLIPGIGMAANSFSPLVNARSIMGDSIDTAGLYGNGEIGPGAGAFSAYHGMKYLAEAPIKAGEEVFADYGEAYFRGRPQVYGMIPLKDEFIRADAMLKSLWEALPKKVNMAQDVSEWQPVWDAILQKFVDDERTRNALPKMVKEIGRAAKLGTAQYFLNGENPRSLEWLNTNGYCMDTLNIQKSSIPNAGRGAFAKKAFTAGERILPMPLLQIPRDLLDIYSMPRERRDERNIHSHQLLLNYCIGHNDSSLLLMPYSSTGNFINHASSNFANAKLVWAKSDSDPSDFHQDDWMARPAQDVLQLTHAGLLLHVVATREIAKGEEVTIDYGEKWEEAWRLHVARWSKQETHISASELNDVEKEIRTTFEDPYPPGVETACHYRYDKDKAATNPNNHQSGKLQVDFIEANAFTWVDNGGRSTMSGDFFRPCRVIARHPDSGEGSVYTVKMENRPDNHEWDKIPAHYQHFVKNVPRRAILFVDKPYTSHQHYEMAFRHEIGFPNPDEMWPNAWTAD